MIFMQKRRNQEACAGLGKKHHFIQWRYHKQTEIRQGNIYYLRRAFHRSQQEDDETHTDI